MVVQAFVKRLQVESCYQLQATRLPPAAFCSNFSLLNPPIHRLLPRWPTNTHVQTCTATWNYNYSLQNPPTEKISSSFFSLYLMILTNFHFLYCLRSLLKICAMVHEIICKQTDCIDLQSVGNPQGQLHLQRRPMHFRFMPYLNFMSFI